MKKIILSVLLLSIIMGLQAQELKVINLNKPDKSRNVTLMQALDKRHSERAFAICLVDVLQLVCSKGPVFFCHGDRILHSVVPQALEKCCEIVLGFDIGWIELGT